MSNQHYQYHRPTSLTEALKLLSTLGNRLVAGGTDVLVQMQKRKLSSEGELAGLVSLRRVRELQGINASDDTLTIGAGTTFTDILESELVRDWAPALTSAAEIFASPQIRNVATLGGNLCNASPAADAAPPLLVYDARVEATSAHGRRELGIDALFKAPGKTALNADEIMTAIHIPRPSPNAQAVFLRRGRIRMDVAVASLAMLLELDGDTCVNARVAAGAVAPTPLRLHGIEDMLTGNAISDDLITEGRRMAEAAVTPITDVRSTEEYRRHLIGVYFERATKRIIGGVA